MGFLQFNEPQNLELFLTDKGKELILRQNGRGFMDLIAQCSFDDQDIDYRRLESNNPCANNPISGTCWYDMPDVRGKRTISEDLLCTVTGSTSGVTCEPCRCVPAVFIGGNRPGPIIFDPVSPTDPTPGDDTTPPPNVIVVCGPATNISTPLNGGGKVYGGDGELLVGRPSVQSETELPKTVSDFETDDENIPKNLPSNQSIPSGGNYTNNFTIAVDLELVQREDRDGRLTWDVKMSSDSYYGGTKLTDLNGLKFYWNISSGFQRGIIHPKQTSVCGKLSSTIMLSMRNTSGTNVEYLKNYWDETNNDFMSYEKSVNLLNSDTDNTAYSVYGTSESGPTKNIKGYFYPLYLNPQAAARNEVLGRFHTHTFLEYPDLVFYMPESQNNHGRNDNGGFPPYGIQKTYEFCLNFGYTYGGVYLGLNKRFRVKGNDYGYKLTILN